MAPRSNLTRLRTLISSDQLRLEEGFRRQYAADKWFAQRLPDAVALPRDTKAVATILRFAEKHRIPVTPRGAGFGYVGGCVPIRGGIVLSLERMHRIKEIDGRDFVAVVEPNVVTKDFQEAVEAKGLFYPPDPASRADCSIGGNIATNAGGPRCLKYGVTRDYVLGLEVVLAGGKVLRLGSRTHKNKSGFDLARFFVGSEGMLGVVTEATMKLLPLPRYRAALSVGFDSIDLAVRTVERIFQAGFLPCALEIADLLTLSAAAKRTRDGRFGGCKSHLIVELDGQQTSVRSEIGALGRIMKTAHPVFVEPASGAVECEKIWGLRREFSYALRDTGLTKLNEDIVVPRGRLKELFELAAKLQRKHKLPVACFGHAGDGNIHVNVMVNRADPGARRRSGAALDDLFAGVVAMGGVITGEHGIGLAKKRWWRLTADKNVRDLHKAIKIALDPRGILNPGKFI
jgi:glycolate oxidase